MVYQTIADDLIWLLLEAASLIPPGHPMAAETAYRKDQFTATFLPAMALMTSGLVASRSFASPSTNFLRSPQAAAETHLCSPGPKTREYHPWSACCQ